MKKKGGGNMHSRKDVKAKKKGQTPLKNREQRKKCAGSSPNRRIRGEGKKGRWIGGVQKGIDLFFWEVVPRKKVRKRICSSCRKIPKA